LDERECPVFELKLAAGMGVPIVVGLWLFWHARR
jgi:hypothetical protein